MDNETIKEEIKRRVKIEDVVSQHVALQRAGSRLKARCPFHEEKTPSFYVNPVLGLYKCFGCGAGGDVYDFVMKIEGLTFPEAGERLAERCGLQWRVEPGEEARSKRRELVRRANDLAAAFYQSLLKANAGTAALEYLHGRGFTDETIERFRLGFAPDAWEGLLRHLRQKGIDEGIAAEAGLAKARESSGHYDVFRNRVMFPIIDASDRVIGFGGRALAPDDPAKYLNTPDTAMFKKGRHVYALNIARAAVMRAQSVIVVEGYTDVISLHQAGIENVVACLGTALTQDHLGLLSRYAGEIVLAYDADAAGMNAAARNVPMLEACTAEVGIVVLPLGLDPDECVRRDGAEGFLALLEKRTTPVEYLVDLEFQRHADRGPDGIMQAVTGAVNVLAGVRDHARRSGYVARVVDRWSRGNPGRAAAIEAPLREELRRRTGRRETEPATARPDTPRDRSYITETITRLANPVARGIARAEAEVLCAALGKQGLAQRVCEVLDADCFCDEAHREIAGAVAAQLQAGGVYSARDVIEMLEEGSRAREVALALAFEDPEQVGEEVLETNMEKLRRYHACGHWLGQYEVPQAADEPPEEPVDDFDALRRRVVEKLNAGVSPDDPEVLLYQRLARRSHGPGSLSAWRYDGPLGARPEDSTVSLPAGAGGTQDPSGENDGPPDEGS